MFFVTSSFRLLCVWRCARLPPLAAVSPVSEALGCRLGSPLTSPGVHLPLHERSGLELLPVVPRAS